MCKSQKRQATEGKGTSSSNVHDTEGGEEKSGVLQLEREASVGDLIWVKLHGDSWWPAVVVDENGVSASCKNGNRSDGGVLVRLYGSHEYLYADLKNYYSEFKMVLGQNNGNLYEIFDKALEQDCSHVKSIKPKGKGSKSTASKGADASKGKKKLQNQVDKKVPDAIARKSRALKAGIQEKLKRKRPSSDKQVKNKANVQERVQKKQRKNNQIVEKMKPKTRTTKEAIKQSAVPKKRPKSSNSEGGKRSKTSKQSEEQKKGKPNSPSPDCTNSRTPKQEKETNSQSSERTPPRKSPKLSARRMRVMLGLGLTAPPGSPFQKN